MTYIAAQDSLDGIAKVVYESKDGKTSKTFEALDWLAQLVTHIPNKGEQMVRYYGFYSNKSRGLRKKADRRHTGELCSNWPEIAIPAKKNKIDNKTCLSYPEDYCLC